MPKQLPTQIGRVIGLSIYCDTVDPENRNLITTADSQVLYMVFKDGATDFFEFIRLDEMLFNFAGVPAPSGEKMLPVNIPGGFDLSTSFFLNPTLLVSPGVPAVPFVIALNVWYIDTLTYAWAVENKIVKENGVSIQELAKATPQLQSKR